MRRQVWHSLVQMRIQLTGTFRFDFISKQSAQNVGSSLKRQSSHTRFKDDSNLGQEMCCTDGLRADRPPNTLIRAAPRYPAVRQISSIGVWFSRECASSHDSPGRACLAISARESLLPFCLTGTAFGSGLIAKIR